MHVDTWRLVADHWQIPDDGIWEMRSGRREFLHSRVMCWVALDRALRLASVNSLPAPVARWQRQRDAIHDDVFARFWDPKRGAFVQSTDHDAVDASSLLMPLVHFISPMDPMWLSHMRVVRDQLVEDATVYRYPPYRRDDGLRGPEGTFSICTFWYASNSASASSTSATFRSCLPISA